MATTECIPSVTLDSKAMETDDESLSSKKMIQGRLPFKPLDHAGQMLTGNTPPGSKKRKLSGNESPSAKQLKTGLHPANTRPQMIEDEPEVSSSSEAETLSNKPNKKLNTLDSFFKPKPYTPEQDEITSTNDCVEIDLTDENEKTGTHSTTEAVMKTNDIDSNTKRTDSGRMEESMNEDKENQSDDEAKDLDGSFITNTSVCEDALKTPGKGIQPESVLKTPVVSNNTVSVSTPQSQGSASDSGTPISGKKSKVLSESKRKERDLQRQKIKEEKDKQKEEQRLLKEKEKEEKKKALLEKKKMKEEQKEKERLEKEKLKQEEKDKKEKERLEKIKQKEEEKKQKEKEQEAKLEEKRKKEEERKQKEEEKKLKEEEKKKEDEEKLRKEEKKKEMFKGFFIKKEPALSPPKPKEMKNGLFMPFELKANMKLAPVYRKSPLSEKRKEKFDAEFNKQNCDHLYLQDIKSTSFGAGHCEKTWPKDLTEESDVELLSHEKETIEKVTHHVKFLSFHENTRPPYYGTWRKRSKLLSARNPFKQDETLFDYEVDSDDEWEEEEPGESVSSDEEEEEGEKMEDEDPDADEWMVPHGYLSDGEGVDDEEVDTASKQDLQKVRQAAWESELKRQAKPLKMMAIGCAWEDDVTATIAAQQLETLLKYKAVCLTEGPINTSLSGTRASEADCSSGKSESKGEEKKYSSTKKSVPEEAMPDLIRLVHGNPVGIKNLIKEFRMFWKKKTNPTASVDDPANSTLDSSKLDMSMEVDDKPTDKQKADLTETPKSLNESKTESQDDFAISKRQLEMKIPAIAAREKRADHKKMCWYVKEEILQQYNMTDLKLPNTWEYVCIKEPTWAQEKTTTPKVEEVNNTQTVTPGRSTPNILQFAQPMSPSQIQARGPATKETVSKLAEASPIVENPTEITNGTCTPGKQAVPADQRSIKDLFSPAARKSIKNTPPAKSSVSAGNPALTSMLTSPAQKSTSPVVSLLSNDVLKVNENQKSTKTTDIAQTISMPPSIHKKLNAKSIVLSPELVEASSGGKAASCNPENDQGQSNKSGNIDKTPTASRKKAVLKNMLTSPELMKPSSSKHEDSKSKEKEEEMEVDGVIILD